MAKLLVEREIYETKDKKQYYGYFVKGVLRGQTVIAHLIPKNKDFDGYSMLDLIFDIASTAELIVKDEKTETTSGAIAEYRTYNVQNTDENGILYSYKLKPRAESDKSLIDVFLQEAVRLEKASEENTHKAV